MARGFATGNSRSLAAISARTELIGPCPGFRDGSGRGFHLPSGFGRPTKFWKKRRALYPNFHFHTSSLEPSGRERIAPVLIPSPDASSQLIIHQQLVASSSVRRAEFTRGSESQSIRGRCSALVDEAPSRWIATPCRMPGPINLTCRKYLCGSSSLLTTVCVPSGYVNTSMPLPPAASRATRSWLFMTVSPQTDAPAATTEKNKLQSKVIDGIYLRRQDPGGGPSRKEEP